jgi:predicted outer membrane repeat protein
MGLSITNNAKFTASNVIFEEGFGSRQDSYGNNWGGAIYTPDGYENAYVNVDNCTFKNNYAVYGGAIYIGAGNLNVSNSLFFNNYAYNYGGAIACDYASNIFVSKSKFYNSRSQDDAGGSIYIRQASRFAADHIDISNSSATFGSALTTLNTTVSLNYVNMTDNSAKYVFLVHLMSNQAGIRFPHD